MRRRLVLWRQWWMAALAGAGVALTHAVSYAIVEHDAGRRAALLHDTGHSIWPRLAAAVVLAALVAALAGALTSGDAGRQQAKVATRLAALQGAGWLAIEAFERAAAGHVGASWRTLAPVAVGLVVQVAVAFAAAALLRALSVVAAAWRARRVPVWPRQRPLLHPRDPQLRATQVLACAWSSRGPPPR